jgi:hypothetical protein
MRLIVYDEDTAEKLAELEVEREPCGGDGWNGYHVKQRGYNRDMTECRIVVKELWKPDETEPDQPELFDDNG